MYMFNRSSEQQNMSQFMKGKILEEEDNDQGEQDSSKNDESLNEDTSKNTNAETQSKLKPSQSQKNKLDEDFMFQMDKGTL